MISVPSKRSRPGCVVCERRSCHESLCSHCYLRFLPPDRVLRLEKCGGLSPRRSVEDQKQRRKARRSALLLLLPGVMFLSAALFILTRIGAFLYVSYLIGMLAVAAALGPGLRTTCGNTAAIESSK